MVDRLKGFAGGALPTGSPSEEMIDPRALAMALWRQRWVILAVSAGVTALAVIYALLATPLYSAQTLVKIEQRQSLVIELPEIAGRYEADVQTIESEINFLQSNGFLSRIVKEQRLFDDPEFNLELDPDAGPVDVRRLFLDRASGDIPSTDSTAIRETLRSLKEAVKVSQVGRSSVISVSVLSAVPKKAARLANAIAETYLVHQLERKFEAGEKATAWLIERIDEIRDRVVQLEDQLVVAQTSQGVFAGSSLNPLAQQIIELNSRLSEAQSVRAEAEVRYNQVQSLLNSSGGLSAVAQVISSPLLSELRAQEAALQRRLSELGTIYGERHPQLVNARAELTAQRSKIRSEVRRVLTDLDNELAVATAQEEELSTSIQRLQGSVADQERGTVSVRELEREALTARTTYERYLERLSEVSEAQNLQEPDATIISKAVVPLDPAHPKRKLIVVLAFVGSLAVGIGVSFVVERWNSDYGFRSGEELFGETGYAALSLVPALNDKELEGSDIDHITIEKPLSQFSEAVQRLRTNLFLTSDGPCRSILITSSMPGEGKTTIAVSLARQSAKAGIRTLLIDADMRKPRAHEALRQMNGRGLVDILKGRQTLEQVMTVDRTSGLFFLRAGMDADSPADLCRSRNMKLLLSDTMAEFDLVIVDSPPVGAVSDGAVLSDIVDRSIYVVAWDATPRPIVQAGLAQINNAGASIAGVVLSKVDLKKQAQYGYGDAGAYKAYYGDKETA